MYGSNKTVFPQYECYCHFASTLWLLEAQSNLGETASQYLLSVHSNRKTEQFLSPHFLRKPGGKAVWHCVLLHLGQGRTVACALKSQCLDQCSLGLSKCQNYFLSSAWLVCLWHTSLRAFLPGLLLYESHMDLLHMWTKGGVVSSVT